MSRLTVLLHAAVIHARSFYHTAVAASVISLIPADTTTTDMHRTSSINHMTNGNGRTSRNSSKSFISRSGKNGIRDYVETEHICPGSGDLLANSSTVEEVFLPGNVTKCSIPVPDLRAQSGVVYGKCGYSRSFCQFLVQVPYKKHINVHIRVKASGCNSTTWQMTIYDGWPFLPTDEKVLVNCSLRDTLNRTRVYMSTTNKMYISHGNSPHVQVWFEAVDFFHLVLTSKHSGYLTYDAYNRRFMRKPTFWTDLTVASGHVLVVSFELFYSGVGCIVVSKQCLYCYFDLKLSWKERNGNQTLFSFLDYKTGRPVEIYDTTKLKVRLELKYYWRLQNKNCMKMLFSFHQKHEEPQQLGNGLFNCSVDNYWTFQQHLNCNRKTECEDGRDETEHCPFRSQLCKGNWVKSRGKCFTLISVEQDISSRQARYECKRRGLKQGTLKTDSELEDFLMLFQGRTGYNVFIGLSSGWTSGPFMYSKFFKWSDNTMIYDLKHKNGISRRYIRKNVRYYLFSTNSYDLASIVPILEDSVTVRFVLCEKNVQTNDISSVEPVTFPSVSLSSSSITSTRQALMICPQGHVTHEFLSCDLKTKCGRMIFFSACTFIGRVQDTMDATPSAKKRTLTDHMPMYACSIQPAAVPYTLVCDFINDCPDKSDESFCNHTRCNAFACKDGPCVSIEKYCNEQSNCLNDSDEDDCPSKPLILENQVLNQSWLINLDGKGYFTYRVMNDSEACPSTHYRCTTDTGHCLPVYTRCNGIYDCLYHEDERDCGQLTCPGFYRCRKSTVCVHIDHLCDGWPQCAQHDDEWMCDIICPEGCMCQGHAFLCRHTFPAYAFPQLRYLDAEGSGMALRDLQNNAYLVHLSLANCFVRFLSHISFPNLKTLDLSRNMIENITLDTIYQLQNLRVLLLRGNPLKSLDTVPGQRQHPLRNLDLSETAIDALDCQLFVNLPEMQNFNASFAQILSIKGHGSRSVSHLKELDIRGNPINRFSDNLFLRLSKLSLVRTSNYRLCCDHLLPKRIPATQCFAPKHFLSSCQNMLRVGIHRGYLWLTGVCAILGNVVCILSHLWERESLFTNTFTTFITSLQCANFFMGIYTSVIVVAHEAFRGQYYRYEDKWTDSMACKAAGFLSLLSSVVAVLTIWLLTLDQFTALHTSLTVYKFSTRSAVVACGLTWIVGSLLASGSLLIGLEPWGRFGGSAVCNFMLSNEHHSLNTFRFLHSTFIFKVMLCLMVTAGIAFIYRALPKSRLLMDQIRKPLYASACLLVKIALTDAIACFSLAVNSFVASGVVRPNTISVAMAVLVVPLNSALNPLLYLWDAMVSRRRQARDTQILRRLKAQLK